MGDKISEVLRVIARTPEFQSALTDPTVCANPTNNVVLQVLFLQHIDPRLARPFLVSFSDAMDVVFLVAAGAMFFAFVLMLFLKEIPRSSQSGIEVLAAELAAEAGAAPTPAPAAVESVQPHRAATPTPGQSDGRGRHIKQRRTRCRNLPRRWQQQREGDEHG